MYTYYKIYFLNIVQTMNKQEKKEHNPRLYELLQENKMSITNERFKIADFMRKHQIFSAQDLVDHFTDISRASLFRTINIYAQIGYIRRVLVPHKAEYYEIKPLDWDHHENMICLSCNTIEKVDMKNAHEETVKKAIEKKFALHEYSVGMLGYCQSCQK